MNNETDVPKVDVEGLDEAQIGPNTNYAILAKRLSAVKIALRYGVRAFQSKCSRITGGRQEALTVLIEMGAIALKNKKHVWIYAGKINTDFAKKFRSRCIKMRKIHKSKITKKHKQNPSKQEESATNSQDQFVEFFVNLTTKIDEIRADIHNLKSAIFDINLNMREVQALASQCGRDEHHG